MTDIFNMEIEEFDFRAMLAMADTRKDKQVTL